MKEYVYIIVDEPKTVRLVDDFALVTVIQLKNLREEVATVTQIYVF